MLFPTEITSPAIRPLQFFSEHRRSIDRVASYVACLSTMMWTEKSNSRTSSYAATSFSILYLFPRSVPVPYSIADHESMPVKFTYLQCHKELPLALRTHENLTGKLQIRQRVVSHAVCTYSMHTHPRRILGSQFGQQSAQLGQSPGIFRCEI